MARKERTIHVNSLMNGAEIKSPGPSNLVRVCGYDTGDYRYGGYHVKTG